MSESSDERQLGVALFNKTWELIEKPGRSFDDDLAMIHMAHASVHHWLNAPDVTPRNRAVGEWQCSRIYAILGFGDAALFHAKHALRIAESNNVDDWVLASAHEAVARAAAAAGDQALFSAHYSQACSLADSITDPDDREHIKSDLETEPWFGFVATPEAIS
jgi:hypothetical protein